MAGEFELYDEAPGFWFYLELSVAADICEYPYLSVKYDLPLTNSKLDMYEIFEETTKKYGTLERLGRYYKRG